MGAVLAILSHFSEIMMCGMGARPWNRLPPPILSRSHTDMAVLVGTSLQPFFLMMFWLVVRKERKGKSVQPYIFSDDVSAGQHHHWEGGGRGSISRSPFSSSSLNFCSIGRGTLASHRTWADHGEAKKSHALFPFLMMENQGIFCTARLSFIILSPTTHISKCSKLHHSSIWIDLKVSSWWFNGGNVTPPKNKSPHVLGC